MTVRLKNYAAAAFHGRIVVLDRDRARESTGHGAPLPNLTHGGPGRAGGGEEMGGVRGVKHHMQRSALQGSPRQLSAVIGRWLPGAAHLESSVHPFRRRFDELAIGDTIKPLSPGETIEVALTVKAKTRHNEECGEVRWAAIVTNSDKEAVATYDPLTMVAI